MNIYSLSSITVNDVTYYAKSTLIAVFIFGLICFTIGIVLIIKRKNDIFLKFKDSKYYDERPNDELANEYADYTEPDELKRQEEERIFNELIKNEEIDEEINEHEYEPDDYVFGLSIRIFYVLFVTMFLAVGILLMRFAVTAKDMDDYEKEHGTEKVKIILPDKESSNTTEQ